MGLLLWVVWFDYSHFIARMNNENSYKKGVDMKRILAVLILLSIPTVHAADKMADIVSKVVKNAAGGTTPAKERIKTYGSIAFAVGGAIYLLASYQENKKFDTIKEEYTFDKLNADQTQRLLTAGKIEGQFNLWRSIRYVSTGSIIAGSFLLGMSMEDTWDLI